MTDHGACPNKEQLFAYAHHLLESNECAEVAPHLERCAACTRTVEEFKNLDAVLDEWKPVAPSGWFDERVRAAADSQKLSPSGLTIFGLPWAQVMAPVCLVVLLVGGSIIMSRVQSTNQRLPVKQQTVQPAQKSAAQVEEELTMYENLPVLEDEDYDMLANFDVLSELPRGEAKIAN